MDFSAFQMQPGPTSLVTVGLFLASLIIWWLVRKKRLRIWLPTLRLMRMESSQLPKLRFVRPPILFFLFFLLASAALTFFTFRPSQTLYQSVEPGHRQTHIFLDMSPSVFYDLDIEAYRSQVREVYEYYQTSSSITLNSSHSDEIFQVEKTEDVNQILAKLQPHRAGLKLGQAIHSILEKIGKTDRLVIISDGDQFTWSDFNWQYLESKFEILYVPIRSQTNRRSNVFIEDVRNVSQADEQSLIWEVEIERIHAAEALTGRVDVLAGNDSLAGSEWRMLPNQTSVTVRVEVFRSQLSTLGVGNEQDEPLTWRLNVSNSAANRAELDNEFRTFLSGAKQDILLISEPQGEMFLEDPVHHLRIALEILGFDVKRVDRVPEEMDAEYFDFPLWIVSGGTTQSMSDFCPDPLISRRFEKLKTGDGLVQNPRLPKVWLLPMSIQANYQQLCHCFASLVERDPQVTKRLPLYCEDVQVRDQYISVLRSLGAKQIGGRVDRLVETIAWHWNEPNIEFELLAFTLPLYPSQVTGINYSQLPLLVRSLAEWMGFLKDKTHRQHHSWPRVADISQFWQQNDSDAYWQTSNVPRGESLFRDMESGALPKTWRGMGSVAYQPALGLQEELDPRPWIDTFLFIIIVLVGLEGFIVMTSSLWKLIRKKKEYIVFLLVFPAFWNEESQADVKLNLLSYPVNRFSAETLARDVVSRTSIEMDGQFLHEKLINDKLLGEGWIWASRPEALLDSNGEFDPKLIAWLKRGGFLIVENLQSPQQMDLPLGRLARDEGWKTIPPDHEIMRSFHLLDSLPGCQDRLWYGYNFDDRIAIIASPFSLLEGLLMEMKSNSCVAQLGRERATRIFINILMVALATDYKKDQIHLPEILKRLR
ncbi:MAG: DUF4159 domain-containing protein [Oligoflexus sp.]